MDMDGLFAMAGAICGVIILILIFVYSPIYGYYEWKAEQACLKQGYSRTSYSLWGESYCILRKDQTDIVVPFDEAMKMKAVP